ncbi:MAG: bifunctional 4-hydroxy-2-oxoglutarate aldolase/2-dehydro-3-deoxy-phosphogluconate aldolase [Bacteroidota bacterium]
MTPFSDSLFLKIPIIGILRGYSKEQVLKIAKVYHSVGFTNIEITMNTPNVLEIIEALAKKYEGQLNVGAGTVLSKEEVDEVVARGGQFIVSPVVDVEVIRYCGSKGIPIFPGAYSPSEIYVAWKEGARMVKVFPARNLGVDYIRDVLAPLDDLELLPTGGVTLENIQQYLRAGAKGFGLGGNLFNHQMIQDKNWEALAGHFEAFKKLFE